MTENELLESLRSFDFANDDQFRDALLESMEVLRLDEQALASEFRVSRTTVNRWVNGNSTPHPAMRRLLVDALIVKVTELRNYMQKIRAKKTVAQRAKSSFGSGSHQIPMPA